MVGDRENAQNKAIIGRILLNIGKAWQYSATLKIIYAQDLPDLVQALGVSAPSACIYRNGSMKFQLTDFKLDMFLESFDISCDWDEVVEPVVTTTPPAPVDTVVASVQPDSDTTTATPPAQ